MDASEHHHGTLELVEIEHSYTARQFSDRSILY